MKTALELRKLVREFMDKMLEECTPTEAGWIVKEMLAGVCFCSGVSDEGAKEQIEVVSKMALDTYNDMRTKMPRGEPPAKS
jgi:hypothetical protein